MKLFKGFLFFVLLSIAGMLPAQKKPSQSDINASKLIQLTNTVIDLSDAYNSKYTQYENRLKNGESKKEQIEKNYDPRFPVSLNGTNTFPISISYNNKYEAALKEVPASVKEKSNVEEAVKKANENVLELEKWSTVMKQYFEGKEFEKDEFKRYPEIKDSLSYYLDATKEAWRTAAKIASSAGEKAEMQLLKDDPAAQFIFPMKADLNSLKNLIDHFYEITDQEEPQYSVLAEEINNMHTSIEKNKNTEGKNVSVLKRETYYTGFYERMEKCMEAINKFITEWEKEDVTQFQLESSFRNIGSQYKRVIDSYNNFATNAMK
ncbi:MAG: YiiG family protein [Candidatus Azobacteroides sp.]|nr:YiiG family protein [Candidatus Azobacteroides sp.]